MKPMKKNELCRYGEMRRSSPFQLGELFVKPKISHLGPSGVRASQFGIFLRAKTEPSDPGVAGPADDPAAGALRPGSALIGGGRRSHQEMTLGFREPLGEKRKTPAQVG